MYKSKQKNLENEDVNDIASDQKILLSYRELQCHILEGKVDELTELKRDMGFSDASVTYLSMVEGRLSKCRDELKELQGQ